jgi:hypothetical protein
MGWFDGCCLLEQVFVNVVYADEIQEFSEKKKLDDEGKEQEVGRRFQLLPCHWKMRHLTRCGV